MVSGLNPSVANGDQEDNGFMEWQPDVLGAGFVSRTLPLLDDDLGPAQATLVRHDPADDPGADPATPPRKTFVLLHLHGWNDYTHSRELAREISRLGGAFYGLDLRRYGRSLREGDLPGYTDSLDTYDEEIGAALRVIRTEHGHALDLVLMGHSTGGLIASLWAHRHPGALRALILNSPWLETHSWTAVRTLGRPVVERLARHDPTNQLRLPDSNLYSRVVSGWTDADGERQAGTYGDPHYDGWGLNPKWRFENSMPVRAGWLKAVVDGHARVADGLDITCPILVLMSTRSLTPTRWTPELRRVDGVLDVERMAERAITLGTHVTIVRIAHAIHDVFLSERSVRDTALSELARFARAYIQSSA